MEKQSGPKKKRQEGKIVERGTLENNYPYRGLLAGLPRPVNVALGALEACWGWDGHRVPKHLPVNSPGGLGLFEKKTVSRGL